MGHKLILLLLPALLTLSCNTIAETPIYKIHEYCRKDKTDASVVTKMQELGLNFDTQRSKFYEPKSPADYRYLLIVLNPQTDKNIQGIHIKWQKSPGLTYEEIQKTVGITLPKRGAKEIHATDDVGNTLFYVLGYENEQNPDLAQVTVTCAKDNYDVCWAIDLNCFGFVHD